MKPLCPAKSRLASCLALFLVAPAVSTAQAQVTLYPVAEAAVRDGVNFGVDIDEASLGYLMVKYGNGTSGKSYYKFNFAGQRPNTNGALDLTFTTGRSSARQHAQISALNQAYPEFTGSSLVWSNAQANLTNSNTLITDPAAPFNATPLIDFISPGTANATATISIPPPWGKFLINHELVLVMASPFDDPTNHANGLRLLTNATFISFTELSGSPPTISSISNITVVAGQTSTPVSFTIGDAEDSPGALTVGASSLDETVVPSGSITIEGSGNTRQLSLTAGTVAGSTTVQVKVTDSAGNTSQTQFTVTVLPLNYAPTVTLAAPVFTISNTPVAVAITVGDNETAAADLVVTGEIEAESSGILAGVELSGSGSNRVATVTPVAGADGVGVVRVDVADGGGASGSFSFPVAVLPATNVVFSEHFDYADGQLITESANFWVRRNSQAQSLRFMVSGQQAYIRPKASTDDVAAPLAGGPYAPGQGAVLYTSFSATWIEQSDVLPAVTNSAGSLVQLLNAPTATSLAVAEVVTRTNDLPEAMFQLGLLDLEGQTHNFPQQLPVPAGEARTTAKIVTRYDVDSGASAIWVNAASEAAPAAYSIDTTNPATISYVGLRQDLGMGYIYVDDLKVTLALKPVIASVTPVAPDGIELQFKAGTTDTASMFLVERTASLGAPFSPITANIVPQGGGNFTVRVSTTEPQAFFRIKRGSMSFQ